MSNCIEESKDCIELPRKDFPVVKELMENEHMSAPSITGVKLRSFLVVRVLIWIPLFLGWLILWSFLNNVLEIHEICFVILVVSILIVIIYSIKDIYRLKKLRRASLIARRLNTSSLERTFPVSDICFVEGIPVQTDYLRSGGDIYVVPFLKDVYVVHLSINELITEVK